MDFLSILNGSKILWGVSTVVMQLGARHVIGDLTDMQNRFLAQKAIKQLVLFAMIFVATRDVMLSAILTAAIYVLLGWVLNENSSLCIVPSSMRPPPPNHNAEHAAQAAQARQQQRRRPAPPQHVWRPFGTNRVVW